MDMSLSGTLFLIEGDPAVRDLVESAFAGTGIKVRSFDTAEAFMALDICRESAGSPACILLSLVMPGQSGADVITKRFGGRAPCPVIMFASLPSVQDAVKAMKVGAVDFLEKPFTPEALTTTVHDALKSHKCPEAMNRERQVLRDRIASLSPRERELLDAIVAGNSTKMIAVRLGISARTVDHHRANLMDKMRAANVADLVRMAVEADYRSTTPPPPGPRPG
jgi:two-component system, LuxR family, response regulator FixJ